MTIDLEAIRKKIAQLEGKGKSSGSKFKKTVWFKPKAGNEYQVRVLPYKSEDGQPFKEIWSYNNIGEHYSLPTLKQYGERDPFVELIESLYKEKDKEPEKGEDIQKMLKLLYPKMRAFSAVIVRGEEDKGPQVWGFGKTMYQALLAKMLDEDFGDITDPEKGFDLLVKVKQIPGKAAPDYELTGYPTDRRAVSSPLGKSKEQAEAWINDMPDLNHLFKKRTYEEMKEILEAFLAGTSEPAPKKADASLGTDKTAIHEQAKTGKSGKVATKKASTDVSPETESDINDVFNSLINE